MQVFTTLFLVILLLFMPFKTHAVENIVLQKTTDQHITNKKLVGSLPKTNIELYATEKEEDLTDFELHIKKGVLYFPRWVNVANPAYYPQLYHSDVNNDGKN